MAYLDIKGLSYSYNSITPVIDDLSLSIHQSEWVAIVGPNGSGKSTLAKLMIGLLKPSLGDIRVDGTLLTKESVYEIRRKIGIIFQNPDNQFVGVTVKDDIAFGLENLQVPYEDMIQRIETYSKVVEMDHLLHKEPSALSGGQKQRVAIAGSLAMQPELMIFDESTSMLDPKGKKTILDTLIKLHKSGKTILTITHDLKETLHADRIIVMHQGKILTSGSPKSVLQDVSVLKKAKLTLLEPFKLSAFLNAKGLLTKEMEDALWAFSLKL
jgi:energy-coupling factor transport system ATP-binding protein